MAFEAKQRVASFLFRTLAESEQRAHSCPGVWGRLERWTGVVCTWSTWSAVINRTSRAGELRSAPSGPDDWHRVAGKRALAQGVRVRRERALKKTWVSEG